MVRSEVMITWLTHQTNDNIPVYWKSSSIARSEISAMRWSNPVAFQVTKRNETLQVGKNTSGSLNGIVMRPTRLFWYSICHQNLPFKTRVVLKHPQVFRFGRKFEFEWNTWRDRCRAQHLRSHILIRPKSIKNTTCRTNDIKSPPTRRLT